MEPRFVILGNGSDWCELALTDFKQRSDAKVINTALPISPDYLAGKIARIHYSIKVNQMLNLPLKSMWFPLFAKTISEHKNEPVVIIIYDRNRLGNNPEFLSYLRNYYSECTLVYMFTNVVRISGANNNGFVGELKSYYDIVYAFDPADAQKYGFSYSPLLYSRNCVEIEEGKEEEDVFYVGRAKDRYAMLISVYEKLKALHKTRDFFIFNVPITQQLYADEITYNRLIPYEECLKHIATAKCLLDVIQGESEGFTIKVCEAIAYDKLLITTNKNIRNAPFYDERFMKIIDSADDIDEAFFENAGKVNYSNDAKTFFSINSFINRLLFDIKRKNEL